jgi:glutathione S-transferase
MLYLHQYPGIWGLPSLSPFCTKVETYLKMVNLPYEVVIENNPRRGPKGKMPVLRDGEMTIPDSSFIIRYLQNKYGNSLDANLSEKEIAVSHAVQRLIEENLYFVILYSRWIDPNGKQIIDAAFQSFFPKPLARLALAWIRRNLTSQAKAQGIGRHSLDEIYQIGELDIKAISQILGKNTFFLGDEPHTIDATVYAFLETILLTPLNGRLNTILGIYPELIAYCEKMRSYL